MIDSLTLKNDQQNRPSWCRNSLRRTAISDAISTTCSSWGLATENCQPLPSTVRDAISQVVALPCESFPGIDDQLGEVGFWLEDAACSKPTFLLRDLYV